jgi:hypothetical protein
MTNAQKQVNDIISSTAAFGVKAGKLLLSKSPGKRGGTSKAKAARKAERKARRGNRK